ncbi:amino acid adenylation domain-containing protein [Bacillus rhizoplanae]|uniref:non-ribosomal peptide synthetase n=1 Tax=Bacillus rhizoplanae TaxID=2880966 RepID=UPI003D258BB6
MRESSLIMQSSEIMRRAKKYWMEALSVDSNKTSLYRDFPTLGLNELKRYRFVVKEDVFVRMQQLGNQDLLAMYTILLANLQACLSRYSIQDELMIGVPVLYKSDASKGESVNKVLPLQIQVAGSMSFKELLIQTRQKLIDHYSNQIYPLDEIFPKDFICELASIQIMMLNLHGQSSYDDLCAFSYNEISFVAEIVDNSLEIEMVYNAALYREETVIRMGKSFELVLQQVLSNPSIVLNDLVLLDKNEESRLLTKFSGVKSDYPRKKTISQLFEEQASKTPEQVAVICEGRSYTYQELNGKANSLARILSEKGVGADSIVGLMMDRSIEQIVGMLAILKAGGAYMPFDLEYPADRITYMINDSKAQLVLTQGELHGRIDVPVECLAVDCTQLDSASGNLDIMSDPDHLLYVIYTSGTTGNPKGVMFTNRGLVNLISHQNTERSVNLNTKVLQFATIAFDVASQEIWSTLLSGGELYLIANDTRKNFQSLLGFVEDNRIETLFLPTSFFKMLVSENEYLDRLIRYVKDIVVAGEQLTVEPNVIYLLSKHGVKLHNHYGPTETHVVTTLTLDENSGRIPPIGKPISNVNLYILDRSDHLAPIGVAGELCISGDCLARGYLNNQALTDEKFVDNPFEPGSKMYRTGDLTRWTLDGNIEYLERIDHQVKIRGFRVEIGEIENQLLKIGDIQTAIVLTKEQDGIKVLCAYYVSQTEYTVTELRNRLLIHLPEYMVPSYFIKLDQIPLTSNGKIDRKAFPEPTGDILSENTYVAPHNELQKKLTEIWSEVLSVSRVGIHDDFFELGGHSLKAITVVTKIRQQLDVEVPVKELFTSKTIEKLSEYIDMQDTFHFKSIEKVLEKEYYEASSEQKRMYLLQQFDKNGVSYHVPGAIEIKGKLDFEKLNTSILRLIERHESLRTVFNTIDGTVVQKIFPMVAVDFEIEQLIAENEDEAKKLMADFVRPFDLHKEIPIRAAVVKLEEERNIFVLNLHHIIADGVTVDILVSELIDIYSDKELEPLLLQYKDYSAWQLNRRESNEMKVQESYWLAELGGEPPILNLPTDYPRPLEKDYRGEIVRFKLNEATTAGLKQIAKESGSTLYMVLLAGLKVLLYRYSGQKDTIVGSPIAGRSHPDVESLIGVFVNTLAIRSTVDGELSFKQYLEIVKEKVFNAFEHQEYPFQELIEQLEVERSMNRNPLFDVMFTFRDAELSEWNTKGMKFKLYELPYEIEKFDLTWDAVEHNGQLQFVISYASSLFKQETIERMAGHFNRIVETVVGNDVIKIDQIEMISEAEKQKILKEFNPVQSDYPRDKTIQELFELQVKQTPHNTAVAYEGATWTYQQLNERANALACTLQKKGVKEETVVGLMLENSIDLIIGIFGILKAGGTYLPIDPQYPAERVQYLLEDSGAQVLLMHAQTSDLVQGLNIDQIDLDDSTVYDSETRNLSPSSRSDNLAYIIYTSGTTGKPKGVAVEHRSLVNLCCWHNQYYGVNETDVAGKYASVGFDASVWEIFPYLIVGASINIIPKNIRFDAEKLNAYYDQNGITIGFLTTSMYERFIKYENKSLKRLLTGGDSLKFVQDKSYEMYNNYGPTECTVVTTSFKIDRVYDNTPIGKPVSNTKVYILSNDNQVMPIGVYGELCIGGEGIARGYFKNEELTNEKFIDNPFEPGSKIYRTGDLARWLPNGNIEFIGRIDYQVKIRGFRIELPEIENNLLKVEGILDTCVLDKVKDGSKVLCAYYVAEAELSIAELRDQLQKYLPEYMIPSYFIKVDHIPLTMNGKIDRKALPTPTGDIQTGRTYIAPQNELQQQLVTIWSEVLGVNKIGIHDDFFELGGHSLKAAVLAGRIYEQLATEIPLKGLFAASTIEKLSQYIASQQTHHFEAIEKVVEQDWYEASSAQKRMYLIHKLDQNSIAYNVPSVIEILGELDLDQLRATLYRLIERHEALRTVFGNKGNLVMQKVLPIEFIDFEVPTLFMENDQEVASVVANFVRPFDLENEIPIRAGIIQVEKQKHILVFDLHHIISDGITMGILLHDFNEFYSGYEVEPLKIQYKDYSKWQLKKRNSEEMRQHESYWLTEFDGELPILRLPTDYSRPKHKDFSGKHVYLTLNSDMTKRLKEIAKETGSTLFMILLAGVKILLSKYSGQEDIVVGSPIAGRKHPDLERIVGMFVNTLAIRSNVSKDLSFQQYLNTLRGKIINAYEHQEYPFEELVEKLGVQRSWNRNPLFDVMFALQNAEIGDMKAQGLNFRALKAEHDIEKFDLTINAIEQQGNLVFDISYAVSLFEHTTIERMVEHFEKIISVIAENPKIPIKQIEIITEAEKQELFAGYNNTVCKYPRDKTIHQWFEVQAEKTPNNIAVVVGDESITYRDLNGRANVVARMLVENGAQYGDFIGIRVTRSIELVIGILAILKTGAAYIPIETNYPIERIKYILQNSNCKMFLTDMLDEELSGLNIKIIQLGVDSGKMYSNRNLNLDSKPSDIAYIIYTSGSTGVPKGVVITHLACLNTCFDINAKFKVNERDVILSIASIGFDLSVYDLFGAFISGAKVVFVKDSTDISEISHLLLTEKISFWNSAPPFMQMVVDNLPTDFECPTLRLVLLSGDWISLNLPPKISHYFPNSKIVSAGGATEGSIWSIYFPITEINPEWKSIPYGYPLGNQQMFIVDEQLYLQPAGIIGEICIGGMGVALGYSNDSVRTAKSFIEHPQLGKIYRTGDLGVLKKEGYIEFLGRKDHQVKIRGFRVELGEIESQLRKVDEIEDVIVLDKEQDGGKILCAYYVAQNEIPIGDLRQKLLTNLPEYMVPSYFIKIDQMPLTMNGKLDRKALPTPTGEIHTGRTYVEPQNEMQQQLARIWSEVLGVSKVGIHDDFFELGGHSLKATTLATRIRQQFDVELPLKELFGAGTIEKLSDYMMSRDIRHFEAIEKTAEKEYYEASSAQKRMYLLQQMDKNSVVYNVPGTIEIKGKVNFGILTTALLKLIERHETLRTVFAIVDGTVIQKILPMERIHFVVEQFTAADEVEAENLMTRFIRPFNLEKEIPIRVAMISFGEERQFLLFDMHHTITDGVSIGILMKEFCSIYSGQELEPLVLQYKDYSSWQLKRRKSNEMKQQEAYWLSELKGKLPILNLPTDYPRPQKKDYRGERVHLTLNEESTLRLKQLVQESGSTLYMVLLAGIKVLLSCYSGQKDIIVGSPIAGRNHRDTESLVGMFVNTLAIRSTVDDEMTFKQYLEVIKQKALNAYEYQEYQFEDIVEKLGIQRSNNRNPLFDVMFILQNMEHDEMVVEGLTFKRKEQQISQEKMDITFTAEESGPKVEIQINYAVSLFCHETIEKMAIHFAEIIEQIIKEPNVKINDIKLSHDRVAIKTIDFEEEFSF